jgi:hypothetical protein
MDGYKIFYVSQNLKFCLTSAPDLKFITKNEVFLGTKWKKNLDEGRLSASGGSRAPNRILAVKRPDDRREESAAGRAERSEFEKNKPITI